jgi:hypothetical protein
MMMPFLRKHWFDLGGFLSIITLVFLYINYKTFSNYQVLMWISLVSLFFHQLEEYRIVGTFGYFSLKHAAYIGLSMPSLSLQNVPQRWSDRRGCFGLI